jgi:hypothetical protein
MSQLSAEEYDATITMIADAIRTLTEITFTGTTDPKYRAYDRFIDDALECGDLVKHSDYKFTGEKLAEKLTNKLDGFTIKSELDTDRGCFCRIKGQAVYFIIYRSNSETTQDPLGMILTWSDTPIVFTETRPR